MQAKGFGMRKITTLLVAFCLSLFMQNAIADTKVVMQTSMGDIKIELDTQNAPITTKNFLNYVNNGFYDGLVFHRIIPNFMIQGGGADENLSFKPVGEKIKNEATNGLKNDRGTIAMARTNDIDSATSQFFINVVNNDFLNYQSPTNYGYAVFGKVVEGMDVVDRIVAGKTMRKGPHQNVPVTPVFIMKAYVVEEAK